MCVLSQNNLQSFKPCDKFVISLQAAIGATTTEFFLNLYRTCADMPSPRSRRYLKRLDRSGKPTPTLMRPSGSVLPITDAAQRRSRLCAILTY